MTSARMRLALGAFVLGLTALSAIGYAQTGRLKGKVVDAENKVTQKRVTLGPQKGSNYVVTEGLSAGDRVVVEGLQKIRNGIVVKPVTEAERSAAAAAPAAAQ
mgnify:CR=1 FL=1